MVLNKSMVLKRVHDGPTVAGQDIAVESSNFDLDQSLPDGSIIVRNLYASFDPYMRGRMRKNVKILPAFEVDKAIPASCISEIVRSSNKDFKKGQFARTYLPIEQFTRLSSEQLKPPSFMLINNRHELDLPIYLAALGMPGLAAYSSLLEIGKPKKGETIFVSGAAGAVGHVVGQIAKIHGLTVIGSAGSDEKIDFLVKELGFDLAFNYKTENTTAALERLAPQGIDIYYDNVGGVQLDAALEKMKKFGRIIASGMMSQYNRAQNDDVQYGLKNVFQSIPKSLTLQGYIVTDPNMGPKYFVEHEERVAGWINDGKLISKATIFEGIDKGPDGFVGMLQGANTGKAILAL